MKNVLFFCTDQHRADHVGFGGNDVVKTPNLDGLASRGTVFDRAYVANPMCMPNRSSILTGRLPSAHGVVFNDRSLDWGTNTFVRRLAQAGYQTRHVGKAHLQVWGTKMFAPMGESAVGTHGWAEGWDGLETDARYGPENPGPVQDFYGYQHAEFCLGHGAAIGGHHRHWAIERGLDPELAITGPKGPAAERSENWWQVLKPMYDEGFHSTEFVTDRAIDFIESSSSSESPWFLFASYPDPHHPYAPPGDWYDRHDPADMVLPESFHDSSENLPAFFRNLVNSQGPTPKFTPGSSRIGEAALRDAMAAEYGSIELLDAGVGRVLAALEASGQSDETIVIFTSDHGDMFGDHGFMFKGGMVFEGTTRVPLLVARPGDEGTRTTSLASSLDIGSTILDLVGVEPFEGVQGTSLVPVIEDSTAQVRDHVLIEEDTPPYDLFTNPPAAHSRTVVTSDARMTRYSTGEGELYDLNADRGERTNLFDDGGGRDLRHEMVERMVEGFLAVADYARPELTLDRAQSS